MLGITVPDQTMIDILKRLEFTVDVQADGSWDVSAPLYREDVESFPDLAEEVIREYGYDHIVPTFLNTAAVTNGGLNYEQKQQLKTKRLLAAQASMRLPRWPSIPMPSSICSISRRRMRPARPSAS